MRGAVRVFDGSISTELALYSNKEEYNDILTHQLPLGNDGEKLPAQVVGFGPVIPKGAKKVAAAKEFINYMREPKSSPVGISLAPVRFNPPPGAGGDGC
jgi:hypothetical protein